MIKALIKLAASLIAGVVCFIIGKLVFIGVNAPIYSGISIADVSSIVANGLSMDFSMSGYLSVLPAICLCFSISYGTKGIVDKILKIYFAIISLVISLIVTLDSALYSYWLFKLDTTPFFYFMTSPSAAFASAEWWMYVVAPVGWLLLAALFYAIYYLAVVRFTDEVDSECHKKNFGWKLTGMIVATAALVIPIRGGVTVSTMNLSRAYFSTEQRMNHAAVNPAFSLLYSATHQNDFSSQYRFFDGPRAESLFSELMMKDNGKVISATDSVELKLLNRSSRPDIYLIILESFSSHLFPSLGGQPVALGLDSIARQGLIFDNFFANSFRTDRGLVSIISGYPGQPSTSIMKFVSKTENLPSFSKVLKEDAGYATTYYYGGDGNFTNMNAYLINSGFDRFICDHDFPVSKRLSKWGAHDEEVFNLAADELTPYSESSPQLKVIQTSSSHEPFEVPYDDNGRFGDIRAKAFAYADSCASRFIRTLEKTLSWENSLVIIVPDHYGAYPDLEDALERHKIPLIMTGGALASKGVNHSYGSQTDISATLLASLGLSHNQFEFSRNLLDPSERHFGFFADPSRIGMAEDDGVLIYNLDSDDIESATGNGENLLPYAKAYLQTLYDDLSKR